MLRNEKGKLRKSRKGFTLVELIVVLAIIGALSAIATPTILSKVDEAKKQTDIANAASIAMAVKSEIAQNNLKVVSSYTKLEDENNAFGKYFDNNVPISKEDSNPFTITVTKDTDGNYSIVVSSSVRQLYPTVSDD